MSDQGEVRVREAAGVGVGERALLMFYETGADGHFEQFAGWADRWLSSRAEHMLRRCPGDRGALAADLVQSVLVKVARSRNRARWNPARSSARTWMNRILRNVVYSHWRSRLARETRRQVKLTEEMLLRAVSGGCWEVDAADCVVKEDECQQAVGLMCQIPDHYRRAIELVVLEGRSHAEASRQLGVSPATVGRHVQKALKLLRNLSEGRCRARPSRNESWLPLSA
jgi:RNA polymerase sigma-70 factor (ECF subfamily)